LDATVHPINSDCYSICDIVLDDQCLMVENTVSHCSKILFPTAFRHRRQRISIRVKGQRWWGGTAAAGMRAAVRMGTGRWETSAEGAFILVVKCGNEHVGHKNLQCALFFVKTLQRTCFDHYDKV
jgi:hypothetical protein